MDRSALIVLLMACVANGQQIMEPSKLAAIRGSLPTLADDDRNSQLHSTRVLWYTNTEIPAAYQKSRGNGYVSSTFFSPFWNISADTSDSWRANGVRAGGNGNTESPWLVAPGGGQDAIGTLSFKGLLLPLSEETGRVKPIVYFSRDLPNDPRVVVGGSRTNNSQYTGFEPVLCWCHPVGTIYIEVILSRWNDTDYPFEVRFRNRELREWGVDIFRPIATATEMAERLASLEGSNDRRSAAIDYLRADRVLEEQEFVTTHHNIERGIDVKAHVYPLPILVTTDVERLLLDDRPWPSVLGETFYGQAVSPSNETGGVNIVPQGWRGAFAGNDRHTCMECHRSTNAHVTTFQKPRGWYGRIRGSDGIFSFHPIDPATVMDRGQVVTPRIRQEFLDAGIVEKHQQGKHSDSDYLILKDVY